MKTLEHYCRELKCKEIVDSKSSLMCSKCFLSCNEELEWYLEPPVNKTTCLKYSFQTKCIYKDKFVVLKELIDL